MNTNYPRVILAGTNSRVGKTTVSIGIILALKKRGFKVQPFKAGPDYIDSSCHTFAAGRTCRNLDTWMLSKEVILELFARQAKISDIAVIEGVMGLYDGFRDTEYGSSAHLAKILKSPVILVVDARSMSRSAAAVVLGYQKFDKTLNLRAVILNNIASPAHYRNVKNAIEKKTGLPVLGFLPRDKNLTLPERHLGLIPADEMMLASSFTQELLRAVEQNIDIAKFIKISRQAPPFSQPRKRLFADKPAKERIVIALAKDAAFNFYYQDSLDILSHYGADFAEFSPLGAKSLPPEACGLYIGGGFPELFSGRLAKNNRLKADILRKAQNGLPIYAECGGLMYLMKNIVDFQDRKFPMAGIFDFSARMNGKLAALGYVDIETIRNNILSQRADKTKAHVFHWSSISGMPKKADFAYTVKKSGRPAFGDGLRRWNVLASYAHLHFGSNPRFAKNFIQHCREYKNANY